MSLKRKLGQISKKQKTPLKATASPRHDQKKTLTTLKSAKNSFFKKK